MNWLSRFLLANWSHIFDAFLLLTAFLCGVQMGESRIQKAWDAEKQTIAKAQAKQEQHVADVRQSQLQISQGISSEFAKNSKLLANRQPNNNVSGVCNAPTAGGRDLSPVSETATGTFAASPYALPAASGVAAAISCEKIIQDAAQTTLMLDELQRWQKRQEIIQN